MDDVRYVTNSAVGIEDYRGWHDVELEAVGGDAAESDSLFRSTDRRTVCAWALRART